MAGFGDVPFLFYSTPTPDENRTARHCPAAARRLCLQDPDGPPATMHSNPAFRTTPEATALAFAAGRGFGTLAVNAPDGPLLSHVPFLLEPGGDGTAGMHLARPNPILRLLDDHGPQPAVLAVAGADAYVSPDWYGMPDQVPTWNYIAVHLRGHLERLPDDALEPHLHRLSATFETRLCPKAPWTAAKMTPGTMARMMRMILPCRLVVARVDSTWKLSQNKPAAARTAAAAALDPGTPGLGQTALATAMMRGGD
jgi:transcriptional regulator